MYIRCGYLATVPIRRGLKKKSLLHCKYGSPPRYTLPLAIPTQKDKGTRKKRVKAIVQCRNSSPQCRNWCITPRQLQNIEFYEHECNKNDFHGQWRVRTFFDPLPHPIVCNSIHFCIDGFQHVHCKYFLKRIITTDFFIVDKTRPLLVEPIHFFCVAPWKANGFKILKRLASQKRLNPNEINKVKIRKGRSNKPGQYELLQTRSELSIYRH